LIAVTETLIRLTRAPRFRDVPKVCWNRVEISLLLYFNHTLRFYLRAKCRLVFQWL